MAAVLTVVALVLLANVVACLIRVVAGPTGRDRVLGVVLSGTTGAALLAVLSVLTDTPALRDVALAVVALATVITVARVRADAGGSAGGSR